MDFKGQLASALVLNVVLKLITFSLSTLLTRQLEPSENGVSFSFLLYYNTVLYLARECVRSVNARYNLVDKAENGTVVLQVINCAFISVPLGILVMIALELISYSGIYVFPSLSALSRVSGVSSIPSTVIANHDETIGIIGIPELFLALSVIITLMIEPCITLLRSFDYFRFIVASEFWALMVRLVVTLIFVRIFGDYFSSDPWIVRMCFATGNFAYALTTVGYFLWLWNSNDCKGSQDRVPLLHQARANAALKISGGVKDHVSISISNWRIFLPWGFLSWSIFYASLMREWSLMFQFFRESTLRLVLAEGERFALVAFGSAAVMGRYDFVASLGSLVARVVFSVWEGACFTKWSRDAACGKGREAVALLLLMLRVSFYFGAAAVLVGPPLAESFLTFAFTRRWATVATVRALQLYTCVLLLLGWNGLLDAFVRATAAARTLQRVQATLLFHAALYVIACFLLLRPTASVDPHSPTERMEENNSNNNNNNSNGDPVVGLLCITAASMALRCVVSLCVLHRSSLQTRVTLWDLRAAFNFRVTAVWALLFLFTRCLHAATAILAGPLFGAAILAWDPEIRGMLLAVVRR